MHDWQNSMNTGYLTEQQGNYANHNNNINQRALVLVGLGNIAKAVGAGEGTVRKWIKDENFPAKRYSDGIYRAEPETVKRWFQNYIETSAVAKNIEPEK